MRTCQAFFSWEAFFLRGYSFSDPGNVSLVLLTQLTAFIKVNPPLSVILDSDLKLLDSKNMSRQKIGGVVIFSCITVMQVKNVDSDYKNT